jgi:hypothetical protein
MLIERARIDRPGVYDMPAEAYHADPCTTPSLSASIAAELLARSPLHGWTKHPKLGNEPREEKDTFDLGSAAHHMVLRQDFWRESISVVDAADWRTKAAQVQRDVARDAGRTPLLRGHYERLERMVSALEKHPQASRAFRAGKPEQSLFWQDDMTGCWMRCRPDWLPDDRAAAIPDYKTTTDARPENWDRRFCLDHGGLLRAAFYEEGYSRLLGIREPTLYYVVQEVKAPYAVTIRVVEYNSPVMTLGRAMLRKAITRWAECLKTGIWPSYEPLIGTLVIPPWAEKTLTENYADWLGATAPARTNMPEEITP